MIAGSDSHRQKESCGVAAVNAIVGRSIVTNSSLRKLQAALGLDAQIFEQKGVCILVLLAALARHGFFQETRCCDRGQAGFCGAAVPGVSMYLLGSG